MIVGAFFTMSQLSPHFSLAELTTTDTGLDNTPDAHEIEILTTLAAFLEKVRVILGNKPVYVDSAFRSAAVNAAVGGVADSAHRLGFAADIRCPDFGSPYDVAIAISKAQEAGHIDFDQLIYEGSWTHVSRDPQLREQRLTHNGDGSYSYGLNA